MNLTNKGCYGVINGNSLAPPMRLLRFNHTDEGLTEIFMTLTCLIEGLHYIYLCVKFLTHLETDLDYVLS